MHTLRNGCTQTTFLRKRHAGSFSADKLRDFQANPKVLFKGFVGDNHPVIEG